MRSLELIVDVDDVIRPFVDEVVKKYNSLSGENRKVSEITSWEISNHLPMIKNFYDFVHLYKNELLLLPGVLPAVKNSLKELRDDDHKIIIATHQFHGLEGLTLGYLYKNNIPYDSIFFGQDKSILRGDVMIDDKVRNLQKFGYKNPGAKLILMGKPWNKDWKEMEPYIAPKGIIQYNNIVRVNTFRDALYRINEYAERK